LSAEAAYQNKTHSAVRQVLNGSVTELLFADRACRFGGGVQTISRINQIDNDPRCFKLSL